MNTECKRWLCCLRLKIQSKIIGMLASRNRVPAFFGILWDTAKVKGIVSNCKSKDRGHVVWKWYWIQIGMLLWNVFEARRKNSGK